MNPNKPAASEERGTSGARIANRLVAVGSAAVLTVYAAGYMRTRSAAQRLDAARQRPPVVIPAAPVASGPNEFPVPSAEPPNTPPAPPPVETANPVPHPAAPTTVRPSKPRRSSPAAKPSQAATPAPTPTEAPPAPTVVQVAEASTPVVEAPVAPSPTPTPQPQYTDGTYSGWGQSRRGDIEATVVIEGGRIVSALISQCWTRWSCSIVQHLQRQVVERQSQEVDYVTGATQSANAFYFAIVEALSKAKCADCAVAPPQ